MPTTAGRWASSARSCTRATAAPPGPARTAPPRPTLSDVFFVDANNGWAVGQTFDGVGPVGAILHTSDGGTTWSPQTSGTTIGLQSVFFADANNGWAVGGGGMLVRTSDGGATWSRQDSVILGTDITFVVVPEPSAVLLCGIALAGVLGYARRCCG